MELRHLRSFVAVAQEQSFTRAADRLNIAQPPLSHRIRELEQELGVRLFDRNTRTVTLTHAGQAFLERVLPLFRQLDGAIEAARQVDRGERGMLRVGYTGRASHVLLPELVRAYVQRYPEVQLDIQGPLATGRLRQQLVQGELDVALCFLPLEGRQLRTRTFLTTRMTLALPASHPLAHAGDFPLEALAAEPFIGYPANQGFHLREAMDKECRRAGFAPRVVRETEASQTLLCLIAAGTGVSIIPEEIRSLEIGGVVYRPLPAGAEELRHGIAWLEENPNPALRGLLELDLTPPVVE